MILGFKAQFVPYVLDGSKTHTIRAGQRWKAGMRADLFQNVRQKNMSLLFRAPVVRVEEICIFEDPNEVVGIAIQGERLTQAECDLFAYRDGFRDGLTDAEPYGTVGAFEQMVEFWRRTHNLSAEPFQGQIIHWRRSTFACRMKHPQAEAV